MVRALFVLILVFVAGCRNADGVGPTGPEGPQGATGPQGPAGSKGDPGAAGAQGLAGTTGAQGPVGPIGPQGMPGQVLIVDGGVVTGPPGPAGASVRLQALDAGDARCPTGGVLVSTDGGAQLVCNGASGAVGPAGPAGLNGLSVVGMSEAPGVNCATGGVRLTSASGVSYVCNGAQGAAGPVGSQGVQGAVGAAGPQGPQGVQGAVGAVGPQGPQGAQGAVGAAGPQGAQGGVGPAGANGQSVIGASEAPGVNCATGGARLTSASGVAYVCNGAVGSQGAAGPAGSQGPLGPQGPAGSQGPLGPQGPAGPGSVTSVAAGLGLVASPGSPITTTGSLAVDGTRVPFLTTNNTFTGSITASSFSGNGAGLSNVDAATLGGHPLSDLEAQFGDRNLAPCTWNGTAVSCNGICAWSTVNGDVTCNAGASADCRWTTFGAGNFCDPLGSSACALSCIDSSRGGWTFGTTAGNVRLVSIPGATAAGVAGRLFVQVRHPVIVCPFRATAFQLPVAIYLYRGGAAEPGLVIWRGTIRTNGGVTQTRDFIGEALPLLGEVSVQPGTSYTLWVSAGPIVGDTTAVCYLAHSASETSNVVLRYQPGRGGF